MRRTLTTIFIVLAVLVLASAGSLQADTLHGFCVSVSCSDNGTVTPVSTGTFTFGFSADPGPTTGTDLLVVLSLTNLGSSINLGGGSATLNTTQWNSGFLDTFLGLTAQPNNGFANYSGLDGGASAFFVYTLNLGTQTVAQDQSGPLFSATGLPDGTFILDFLTVPGDDTVWATPNSAALQVVTPEPGTIALLGTGLFSLIGFARRKVNA
jgi:hypothetical protein